MAQDNLNSLIDQATEEQLRDIVREWIESNGEFQTFVKRSLDPPVDEIDFDTELARALMHEAKQSVARRGSDILNWSNIYYYHIEPWAKKADSLNTSNLWKLVVAIITRVAMIIDDEDFSGDDWYGDDYSREIGSIIDTLGNLCGLLVTKSDLTDDGLAELENIIKEAQDEDRIANYLSTPYNTILELIAIRREADEICCGLYDMMIDANYDQEAGAWVCRKVDFVRSMGSNDEALSLLESNLKYPEVCLKYYNELMATNRWQDALVILDKAQKLKEENGNRWLSRISLDYLAMKQNILMEYGKKEVQIDNLTEMFYNSINEKKLDCYMRLKALVGEADWKNFYTKLLSRKPISFGLELDSIAPFLVMENELGWLYRELVLNEQRDKTDYRRPLKYAQSLMLSHDKKIRAMLVRTFREYAASRFIPKKRVSGDKYAYFCNDLQSLTAVGANEELIELLNYFKLEYRTRPSLLAELRRVKTL